MANTLLMVLDAPLQSWGERARWAVRDTCLEPTHSAIAGLLGCASGLGSGAELDALASRFTMGVRCDRPGALLRDYHTIVGGVLSANGKLKLNAKSKQPETVVSWRYYMADACYLVALQAEADDISAWAAALQDPVWPPYLGRKACVPSRPIYEGTGDYPTVRDALRDWPPVAADRGDGPARVRAVVETKPGQGARRNDALVNSRARVFGPRYVAEYMVSLPREEV